MVTLERTAILDSVGFIGDGTPVDSENALSHGLAHLAVARSEVVVHLQVFVLGSGWLRDAFHSPLVSLNSVALPNDTALGLFASVSCREEHPGVSWVSSSSRS